MRGNNLSYVMFRGVNCGGSLFFYDGSRGCFQFLPWPSLGLGGFFPFGLLLQDGLLVIMTVLVAAQMLSSNVEYLSARLYNSSIITGRSKDREERGRWCEASLKVLKDCVHAVNLSTC